MHAISEKGHIYIQDARMDPVSTKFSVELAKDLFSLDVLVSNCSIVGKK